MGKIKSNRVKLIDFVLFNSEFFPHEMLADMGNAETYKLMGPFARSNLPYASYLTFRQPSFPKMRTMHYGYRRRYYGLVKIITVLLAHSL